MELAAHYIVLCHGSSQLDVILGRGYNRVFTFVSEKRMNEIYAVAVIYLREQRVLFFNDERVPADMRDLKFRRYKALSPLV